MLPSADFKTICNALERIQKVADERIIQLKKMKEEPLHPNQEARINVASDYLHHLSRSSKHQLLEVKKAAREVNFQKQAVKQLSILDQIK